MASSALHFEGRRSTPLFRRLRFEALEDRRMLAVFTVTNLDDFVVTAPGDAPGTLRQAIFDANILPDADLIQFASNLSGAVHLANIGDIGGAAGPSDLLISSPITIRGNAHGITIDRAPTATDRRLVRVTPAGNLTLESITLSGGTARGANIGAGQVAGNGFGGAVYSEGTLSLIGSMLSGNSAVGGNAGTGGTGGAGLGGAIYNDGGSVSIDNSTISGNSASSGMGTTSATSFAGAVYSKNGLLNVYNSTITNGTATSVRDVFIVATGIGQIATARIYSSIIAHADLPSHEFDFVATEENGGHIDVKGSNNLIRRQNDYESIAISTAAPLLGALANNGGPTWTHALLGGSPAIDHGLNPLGHGNDQRGSPYLRVFGEAADIGAFEAQAVAPALPGDYNGNNIVDAADYIVWQMTRGTTVPRYSGADGNGDTTVDALDYEVWRNHFGETGGQGASIGFSAVSAKSIELLTQPSRDLSLPAEKPSMIVPINMLTSSKVKRTDDLKQAQRRDPVLAQQVRDEALLSIVAEHRSRGRSVRATTPRQGGLEDHETASKSADCQVSIDGALNRWLLQTGSLAAASIGTA